MCVCEWICAYVCIYVSNMCMYVRVYVCVNVYVCMCVCTFVGCTYVCVIFNFHDQYFTFSPQSSFTSLVKYIPGLWFPGACCK